VNKCGESKGDAMSKVKAICRARDARARELRAEGKKIIGYLCYFAPPEIIAAAGMVPFRIMGRLGDDVVEANSYLEPYGCPYVRNCFEQALKGRLNFLDGLVVSHSCDMVQRIYGIWKYYQKPAYGYLFNVPHQVTPWSRQFFIRELAFFKESLEKYAGQGISEERIARAIELSNENRRLVKELYEFRSRRPSVLSGPEMLGILIAGMSIPPDEFNALLKELKMEVEGRSDVPLDRTRVLLWGSIIDDPRLYELIEECGATVVIDDTCIGSRAYFTRVDLSNGVFEGLADAYFGKFPCPRTDRGPGTGRFEYVLNLAREYRVKGVIGYTLSFCDPHKLDYPDLRDYLAGHGYPMLLIDDDYTLSHAETVKTRIEAFREMLAKGSASFQDLAGRAQL